MGKSRATKPTYAQKQIIAAAGYKVKDYLVIKESEEELYLVIRGTGETLKLSKEPRETVKSVARQKKRCYRKKEIAYGN